MALRTKVDARRCIAASVALLAAAILAGCEDDGPYADESGLPRATYYTVVVRPGDTLSELAHRYDSSVADVATLNRIGSESRICAGQTLRVPARDSATRVAVLDEAGNYSAHNYAPPPKPIDVTRFESHGRVTVQNLPPPASESPQSPIRAADSQAQRFVPTQESVTRVARADQPEHGSGRFGWPVSGQVISPFGTVGRGERNDGINIATETGTPIHAAAAGTITYAGNELKGYGNLVLIQHDDGYITAYAHAQSISVNRGDRVEKGQVIGLSGATGNVDRPQLHFEIRKGVQPINPRLLLASRE